MSIYPEVKDPKMVGEYNNKPKKVVKPKKK